MNVLALCTIHDYNQKFSIRVMSFPTQKTKYQFLSPQFKVPSTNSFLSTILQISMKKDFSSYILMYSLFFFTGTDMSSLSLISIKSLLPPLCALIVGLIEIIDQAVGLILCHLLYQVTNNKLSISLNGHK